MQVYCDAMLNVEGLSGSGTSEVELDRRVLLAIESYLSVLSNGSSTLPRFDFRGSCITGDGSICDVLTVSRTDGRSGLTYADCLGWGCFDGALGVVRNPPEPGARGKGPVVVWE